jgi:hypothetical protein
VGIRLTARAPAIRHRVPNGAVESSPARWRTAPPASPKRPASWGFGGERVHFTHSSETWMTQPSAESRVLAAKFDQWLASKTAGKSGRPAHVKASAWIALVRLEQDGPDAPAKRFLTRVFGSVPLTQRPPTRHPAQIVQTAEQFGATHLPSGDGPATLATPAATRWQGTYSETILLGFGDDTASEEKVGHINSRRTSRKATRCPPEPDPPVRTVDGVNHASVDTRFPRSSILVR